VDSQVESAVQLHPGNLGKGILGRITLRAMKPMLIAALLLLGATGRAQAPAESTESVAWAPILGVNNLDELGRAMRQEEERPVKLERNGQDRTVQNCDDYLSALRDGFSPASDSENEMALDYVWKCFALQFLRQVNSHASVGVIKEWPEGLVASLPPLVCPGECNGAKAREWKAALDDGTPWMNWDSTLTVESVNGTEAYLQDDAWEFSLSLVVQSDSHANGSQGAGEERFGILACASAQQGTYHDCEFVVLAADGPRLRQIYSRP
jgi:hypothetical protein